MKACVAALCLVLLPDTAHPQTGPIEQRVEWSFGVGANGPTSFSPAPGELTRPSGASLELFKVDARLGWAAPVATRLAFRLTRSVQFEATGALTPNTVTVRLTDDDEAAGEATLTESARQLLVEGGLVLHLKSRGATARTVPFISTGFGVFWEVHEQGAAQVGKQFFGGVGLKHTLRARARGRFKVIGVRGDLRFTARVGGMALDDGVHVLPGFGASLFIRF